jgi:RNA polymerase sigma-70 factor (ECF subfamily)
VSQDDLYQQAISTYGAALERLVRAYEADPDERRDLSQDVHFAIWRSFSGYQARCSLRTWVYRVAHNTAASHIVRRRRANLRNLVSLEEVTEAPDSNDPLRDSDERLSLNRLYKLVHQLRPLDRQLMLLYLEGMDTESIADITGASAGSVRTQIHRIKVMLARRFHAGGRE